MVPGIGYLIMGIAWWMPLRASSAGTAVQISNKQSLTLMALMI
jgi:hypothetical protein